MPLVKAQQESVADRRMETKGRVCKDEGQLSRLYLNSTTVQASSTGFLLCSHQFFM